MFLLSALAPQVGWRWRLPLLALAVLCPAAWLWTDPPIGPYGGLGFSITLAALLGALITGVIGGSLLRGAGLSRPASLAGLTLLAAGAVSLTLWQQYVPQACLDRPLQIRIAGMTLQVPAALQPRLEHGDEVWHFGRSDRKSGTAQLCRASRNGTQPLEMDRLWITPAASHEALPAACGSPPHPGWCTTYAASPFRHMGRIVIEPATGPPVAAAYWDPGGSLPKITEGDLRAGSTCLPTTTAAPTRCWVWHPLGPRFRLLVSTYARDPVFADMPVASARDMTRRAGSIALAILRQP